MQFKVLGSLEVTRDGTTVRIGSRMQRRLLALLLVHAGECVPAERIIDVLWEGQPPPSAPSGLHTYVSRLRRLLGQGVRVDSDTHGYRLRMDGHMLDARCFEQQAATARRHLTEEPAAAAAELAEALALWRGPAYAEFADDDFARPEAVRLDELRLAVTEDAFAARLACGDVGLIGDLEAFVTANPLRERPYALLMTALAQTGRQTDALEAYQRLRTRLADELGLEPSPALQQLQADILRHAPNVTPAGPDAVERNHALPAGGNLPQPVTSFVGRRHETDAVCRLLERHRLVTLTGVGGVGKTRLALQAAAAVSERYPDGMWWCELAPADPGAVGHTVAAVLGVQQQANRSINDSIVGALAGKRLLLVLDNCEHLIDATAQLAEHIVRSCPHATILATSREPLAVAGEQVWPVPPLPLPSDRTDGEGLGAPSAQLFCDRARAYRADFTVGETTATAIGDICRQLDGLPLAIELAAALTGALEPSQIARRLGHRFRLLTHGPRTDPRHRSLVAVVEWSYQLLEPAEQRLFDRLAVFAGGFTLAAAEGVCADGDLPATHVAGLLAGLVSRSMVEVDRSVTPARYRLLETLRQYAAQQLAERGEEQRLRARHAHWFVELAERADADVRGRDEAPAVAMLEAELSDLRVAHRWAVEHADADVALRLTAALYIFALYRLRDEVFVWAEEAAGLPAAVGHRLQPTVCGMAAHGISNRGELTRTRSLAQRALQTAPSASDPGRLVAMISLAATALYEGRLDDCRGHTRDAIALAADTGNDHGVVMARLHEVLALAYDGQRDAALAAAAEQQRLAEELGNPNQRAWALYADAEARSDDDPEAALGLLEEAISLAEPVHGRFLEGVARVAATSLRARHQSSREALTFFPDVIGHWRRVGDWTHQWTTIRNLVPLLVRLNADEPAALLYGALLAADTAAPAYGADAGRLAQACETMSSRLGAPGFAALVEQGAGLSDEDAVDLSLAGIADILTQDSIPKRDNQPERGAARRVHTAR